MNYRQIQNDHYNLRYDGKKRFISYWYQVKEITDKSPSNIMEVGIGNGFLSRYIRRHGYNITTVDIDKKLNPDYIASVLSLPFTNNVFDVVACFEVLEHLPYEQFEAALRELKRVSRKHVIISVPDAQEVLIIKLPVMGIRLIPLIKAKKEIHSSKHFWEINAKGYRLRRILDSIQKTDLRLEKNYRIPENPHHRMFVLRV